MIMSLHYVTKKKNKYRERFSLKKLKRSLLRSGASQALARDICQKIKDCHHCEEISSTALHNHVMRLLRRKKPLIAANYRLKRGISELGPSGYPFEVLCGEILKSRGYKTQVGKTVQGAYVSHEVDVIAKKPNRVLMGECKYHNSYGHKNDVKIPLYIKSRADDINKNPKSLNHDEFVIFSNTVFTLDAQKYAKGVGLRLVSLDDNDDNVIEYMKACKLYPITCLSSLKKREHQALLKKKIVTISQLDKKIMSAEIKKMNFSKEQIVKIQNEIKLLQRS